MSSNKNNLKQRPQNKGSLFWRNHKVSRRAKYYTFKLMPNRALLITVRRFNTSPHTWSKTYSQLIVRINIFGIKELAIRYKRLHRLKKNPAPLSAAKFKPSYSTALMFVGLLGLTFFGLQIISGAHSAPPIVNAQSSSSQSAKSEMEQTKKHLPSSIPLKLVAQSINVNVDIKPMGQQKDGTIETPGLFENVVGWYKFSPTPGELGPAVILGHVDTYKGPSVFWRLGELKASDNVQVLREDGSTANFLVTGSEQYDQNDFPTEIIYGNTLGSELRLITCGGTFNYKTLHYSKNTVVYAKLVL